MIVVNSSEVNNLMMKDDLLKMSKSRNKPDRHL